MKSFQIKHRKEILRFDGYASMSELMEYDLLLGYEINGCAMSRRTVQWTLKHAHR
jgi:hypothetical protein